METVFWLLVFGEENPSRIHRSPVDSPHEGTVTRALMFSLMLVLTNGWANNLFASDLRHHDAHVA